jgi:hypothetical protein
MGFDQARAAPLESLVLDCALTAGNMDPPGQQAHEALASCRSNHRDIVHMPAGVKPTAKELTVSFHRRAHLLILVACDLMNHRLPVPWWNDLPFLLTTCHG